LEKKENKESSGADPNERSPKKTKKKEGPKIKKEMEYPKAHRIGRRKDAREFKNPKEISKKLQNKINMLTKNPKRKKIQEEERRNLFHLYIRKCLSYLPYNRVCFL